MSTLDQAIAREFRTAQLQRRRWGRVWDAFAKEPMRLEQVEQMLTACRAASELEYRQSARRLFHVLDLMTSDILPWEEEVTEAQKLTLLSRAEWHKKLARESRPDDVKHAEMHERVSAQLREYALRGAPVELKAVAPEGRKIKRSYL